RRRCPFHAPRRSCAPNLPQGYRIWTVVAVFPYRLHRRDPRNKSGEGSRATSSLLQPWIPACAGMTKEGNEPKRPYAIALRSARSQVGSGGAAGGGPEGGPANGAGALRTCPASEAGQGSAGKGGRGRERRGARGDDPARRLALHDHAALGAGAIAGDHHPV